MYGLFFFFTSYSTRFYTLYIRNLKRPIRLKVNNDFFRIQAYCLLVITNIKKIKFDIANDSRFYSSKSQMIREYDSINFRLGTERNNSIVRSNRCYKTVMYYIKDYQKIWAAWQIHWIIFSTKNLIFSLFNSVSEKTFFDSSVKPKIANDVFRYSPDVNLTLFAHFGA
jgi:hypothetical protein